MSEATERWREPRTLASQWAGVLLGPAAWAAHLQVSYTLSALACDDVGGLSVHAVSVVALAIAAGGGFIGWRNWEATQAGGPEGDRLDRSRFMALSGLGLSAFFGLAIVAQWIPVFFLEPCRY